MTVGFPATELNNRPKFLVNSHQAEAPIPNRSNNGAADSGVAPRPCVSAEQSNPATPRTAKLCVPRFVCPQIWPGVGGELRLLSVENGCEAASTFVSDSIADRTNPHGGNGRAATELARWSQDSSLSAMIRLLGF